MARTSNRYLEKNKEDIAAFYACGYYRVSVSGKENDSDSIETQRYLIRQFMQGHSEIVFANEFIDDGKTGTSFKRPGFEKMMTEVEGGRINCILVKDLSRIGRNYIEVGRLLEEVFPAYGVRLISVGDGYDSFEKAANQEQFTLMLKNLMHELYAKDISRKISAIYEMKQQRKEFYRSPIIPYGYEMDMETNNYKPHMEASKIVSWIFCEFAEQKSIQQIKKALYQKKILPPAQFYQKGYVYAKEETKLWQESTLRKILQNEVYMGVIVRHKTEQKHFKNLKQHLMAEEGWIRIKENHPSIVSAQLFQRVQKILKRE